MERKESQSGMLELILQPAFMVKNGKITHVNMAAEKYFLEPGMQIEQLLCTGRAEYKDLEQGQLYMTLSIAGVPYGASVRRMPEGDIFTLEQETEQAELRAMALAAKELRGPLSNVMSMADQLFPVADEDPEIQSQVAKINRGLFQMLRIIGNMSDTYRYSQQTETQMEVVNITALMQELFDRAAEQLSHGGIQLLFENLPQQILGLADTEKLDRAVHNIISNAVKFAKSGSPIHARLSRKRDMLYLTVQDEGQGIEDGLRSNVHSRFRRQPGLEDGRYGIGLGMVMIRLAAAAHGGTVLIDHPEHCGTRLTMSIAIRQDLNARVRSPIMHVDYAGERNHCLIELSDVLPSSVYTAEKINGITD